MFGLWLVLDRKSYAGRQRQVKPQFDVNIEVIPVEACDIHNGPVIDGRCMNPAVVFSENGISCSLETGGYCSCIPGNVHKRMCTSADGQEQV